MSEFTNKRQKTENEVSLFNDVSEMENNLFDKIENMFKNVVIAINEQIVGPRHSLNVCCNEDEKKMLMGFASQLRDLYPTMTLNDIYFTIIFVYYSLNLGEQTTDFLQLKIFEKYLNNQNDVKKLYLKITTQDDNPIYSQIRRTIFGFQGGKRRKMRKMRKMRKTRKMRKIKKNKTGKRKSKRN